MNNQFNNRIDNISITQNISYIIVLVVSVGVGQEATLNMNSSNPIVNVNVCAWCVVRVDSVPFLRFMFLIWDCFVVCRVYF